MISYFRWALLWTLATGLTACSAEAPDQEPVTQPELLDQPTGDKPESSAVAESVMALDGEGLRLVNGDTGSTSLLSFGASRAAVEQAVAEHLGAAEGRSSNDECGAGAMDFTSYGEFIANFQDDRFVGWDLRERNKNKVLTTINGIGIGTKRSEMAESMVFDMYDDSTIGIEFYTSGDGPGGFSGLFESEEPDARITNLWAGTNCIFR